MKTKQIDIFTQNNIFVWVALGTGAILLIPLALQHLIGTGVDGQGFNWKPSDFIAMGVMLAGTGSAFVFAARTSYKKFRIAIGVAFLLAFLWLWAELAVGIFTTWGS